MWVFVKIKFCGSSFFLNILRLTISLSDYLIQIYTHTKHRQIPTNHHHPTWNIPQYVKFLSMVYYSNWNKRKSIECPCACVCPQQHLWDDEMRNKANGGLNACGSTIFNNLQNNNCNGINIVNEHGDGNGNACINNNQQNQFNGSDKFSPELFAISYSERMRRHSTMSHKIVIQFYLTT